MDTLEMMVAPFEPHAPSRMTSPQTPATGGYWGPLGRIVDNSVLPDEAPGHSVKNPTAKPPERRRTSELSLLCGGGPSLVPSIDSNISVPFRQKNRVGVCSSIFSSRHFPQDFCRRKCLIQNERGKNGHLVPWEMVG